MFCLTFLACGQDSHLVEGKVTNNSNEAIDSVLIQVMGTDLNSYSDESGNFRINTRNRGDELIFSKKGYEMQRLPIENRENINVELQTEE